MFISYTDPLMNEPVVNQFPPTPMDLNYMCDMIEEKHLPLITANQIGISYRMFIQYLDGFNTLVFNPTFEPTSDARICVIEKSPQLNSELAIDRYREIMATWEDEDGQPTTQYLTGMNAATFQSGVDYLNGLPPWAYSKRKVNE